MLTGHRRVTNASTGEGYLLSVAFTTNPSQWTAHIDNSQSPSEPVPNTDVVVWYAAHFLHDEAHTRA